MPDAARRARRSRSRSRRGAPAAPGGRGPRRARWSGGGGGGSWGHARARRSEASRIGLDFSQLNRLASKSVGAVGKELNPPVADEAVASATLERGGVLGMLGVIRAPAWIAGLVVGQEM